MAQATLTGRNRGKQAARPQRVSPTRLWLILVAFTLFAAYNLFTVFKLQVIQYNDLSSRAESGIKRKDTLVPRRGLIYDSRGQLLAGNATAYDVYVDLTHVTADADLHEIADLLAPTLGQDAQAMFSKFRDALDNKITYSKVASRVDEAMRAKVVDLGTRYEDIIKPVVNFEVQSLRNYPNVGADGVSGLAASVLGFADYDNQGHYGVEEYYNSQLAGEAGWIDAERDAYGNPLALEQPEMQPAVDGSDLVLTIDSGVQYLVERGLLDAIKEYQADSGYAIVQDPNTGAILAMANTPSFNPNTFNTETNYENFKNPAVTDVREPGSTMKILTYSSAIDAGAILSTTTMYGTACVYPYGVELCNAEHTVWGNQTMEQGLARSDNVAAIFAAEQLGPDKFYDYIKNFGIGTRTGIDMAGETAGIVSWPDSDNYSPIDFYTTAFGQSAAVTPIQLVNAVSAVANGGMLLKPYVMQEIRNGDQVAAQGSRQEVRRVVGPSAAHDVAQMLAYGVENGGVARLAAIDGYHVSVKTGTANVIGNNGGYLDGVTFASAMGFAPTVSPRFVLYIGLMHPRTSQWGENTASAAWGKLGKQLLMYMKIQPDRPVPTPTAEP
jgi:cell division protein FtsI/penicillin-binding protein 2